MAFVPTLLITQVRMAAPFLFTGPEPEGSAYRYLRVIRAYGGGRLDALGYYELCLCSHWATAGSFLPTDVDHGIRWKLWQDSSPGSPLFGGRLGRAGGLNKRFMSADNHRHYPLRAAKGLRRSADLLLPVGPFFDDWGRRVGRHPGLTPVEVAEAVRALTDGWVRMHEPAGYARALSGILETFPGGRRALGKFLPAKDRRMLESGPLKAALDVPQERFEAQWAHRAAKLSDTFEARTSSQ